MQSENTRSTCAAQPKSRTLRLSMNGINPDNQIDHASAKAAQNCIAALRGFAASGNTDNLRAGIVYGLTPAGLDVGAKRTHRRCF